MADPKTLILCVDDEETPLILRKLVLEKEGFQVVTASSATQALEVANSIHVDVVVSDHLMPGTTGGELARRLKAAHPDLPIILLSGVNEIPADASFADAFISKVEGPGPLREKILSLTGKKRP